MCRLLEQVVDKKAESTTCKPTQNILCITATASIINIAMFSSFLDLISLRNCLACEEISLSKNQKYLCSSCQHEFYIDFNKSQKLIDIAGSILPKVIYYSANYKGHARKLIKKLKYHRADLAKFWAEQLSSYWQRNFSEVQNTNIYVCPIPLHRFKKWRRGYNQAELIAQNFAKQNQFKYIRKLFKRVKNTETLFDKDRKSREKILKNAFTLKKKELKTQNNTLIIIDDITTTGTTLIEAYKCAKENKVFNEIILVACTGNKLWC